MFVVSCAVCSDDRKLYDSDKSTAMYNNKFDNGQIG